MNKKCDKTFCLYHNTCIISEDYKIKKCNGVLSNKNPHSDKYQAITKKSE